MKKFIILFTFSLFFSISAFAADSKSENSGVQTQHTPHPPHDHHDTDHLKYLRSQTDQKKRKSSKK